MHIINIFCQTEKKQKKTIFVVVVVVEVNENEGIFLMVFAWCESISIYSKGKTMRYNEYEVFMRRWRLTAHYSDDGNMLVCLSIKKDSAKWIIVRCAYVFNAHWTHISGFIFRKKNLHEIPKCIEKYQADRLHVDGVQKCVDHHILYGIHVLTANRWSNGANRFSMYGFSCAVRM